MSKNPRFDDLCREAKSRVREISASEAQAAQAEGAVLIDVREKSDFEQQHLPGAIPLSKGVIEMKIEERFPDPTTPVICYCGGGNRSALVADNLQKMGYQNVCSMKGGFKSWVESGLPTES